MTVRVAGVAYLVFLGCSRYGMRCTGGRLLRRPRSRLPAVRALRQGILSNLGNPKMAVFFTGLLPQFVAHEGGSVLAPLFLGLTFCSMTLAWLSLYAVLVARAGDLLRRPGIRRVLDAAAGAVLVGFGARVATEQD